MKRKYITVDDAIKLLPDGEYVHTFYQMGMGLIGADWDKEDVIAKLKSVDYIELTGKEARNMGHGIAVYNKDTKWQSDVLFIETDKTRLNAFDPIKEVMALGEAIAIFNMIDASHKTTEEKGEAIKRVLDMETHNSITKDSMLKVIKWLWDLAFEEESCQ